MQTVQQIRALLLLLLALGPAWALGQNPGPSSASQATRRQSTPSSAQAAGPEQTEPPPTQNASLQETIPAGGRTSATPDADGPDSEIRALRQVEENYLRAEMEDNAQLASSLIADDYVGVTGDGSTSDKLAILDRLSKHSRSRQPYRITAANMEEHVFGDTACVTYTKIYTQPNSQAIYSENVLHILTKRNGAWRLQVSSPIPSPKP
jgi:ketosteroid isomerase-like protein